MVIISIFAAVFKVKKRTMNAIVTQMIILFLLVIVGYNICNLIKH